MTREEYKIKVIKITKLGMDIHHTSQALFMASEEYISYLQATIEAQEIIIKDKSDIMEAMAQRIKHLELPKNNGISSLDIKNINASKMMGIIK